VDTGNKFSEIEFITPGLS